MKFEDMINTIQLGDCYELIKNIPDKSIDLVLTDPPYMITTTGAGLYKQKDKQYILSDFSFEKLKITAEENGYEDGIVERMQIKDVTVVKI